VVQKRIRRARADKRNDIRREVVLIKIGSRSRMFFFLFFFCRKSQKEEFRSIGGATVEMFFFRRRLGTRLWPQRGCRKIIFVATWMRLIDRRGRNDLPPGDER